MANFSLNEFWWNKPPRTESQLPALQLGVQMVQNRARLDLAERQLADDMARTDIARTESLAKLKLQTDISAANAELARLAAQVTDFSDPAQMKPIYDLGSRFGYVVGTKGWEGIINTHERAVTAKRLGENTQSIIDERNRRAAMAENMGWVYPEDGSPPYLVDAKGGTRFAPFRAGLDDNFTPEETKIGDVTLIRTSPNRWQVVNKSIPAGRMTDLEKVNLSEIRKERQALVDTIASEAPTLKTGIFGGVKNQASVDAYKAKADKIAALTAKESALVQAVEARDKSPISEPKTPRAGLQTNEPPAAAPAPASPMPSTKDDLVKDQIYQTPRGRAKWDGEKFIPQ